MNRLALEAIGLALVIAAGLWYRSHLIDIGEDRIKAKDAEIVAAQQIHNQEVERRAEVLTATQIGELKAKLAAPAATDAPRLECVSNRPRSPREVPHDASAGPDPHAATEQPGVVPQPRDFGPAIDKRFADDDALIKALQDRIAAEVGVCR